MSKSFTAKGFPFLVLAIALLAALSPDPPPARAGVMLVCDTTCPTPGNCMVTAACSPAAPNTCSFMTESIIAANNAVCTLGAIDGSALAMATMGTPATCSFYFGNLCGATSMCTMGFFTTVVNSCVVNTADGLPVELLGFSVEEEGPDSSDGNGED